MAHGCNGPLIESDIWPIEWCHRQWPSSTCKVI